jgi:hypothetical protein
MRSGKFIECEDHCCPMSEIFGKLASSSFVQQKLLHNQSRKAGRVVAFPKSLQDRQLPQCLKPIRVVKIWK